MPMAQRVHESIEVEAPVEDIFRYWSNCENFPKFVSDTAVPAGQPSAFQPFFRWRCFRLGADGLRTRLMRGVVSTGSALVG